MTLPFSLKATKSHQFHLCSISKSAFHCFCCLNSDSVISCLGYSSIPSNSSSGILSLTLLPLGSLYKCEPVQIPALGILGLCVLGSFHLKRQKERNLLWYMERNSFMLLRQVLTIKDNVLYTFFLSQELRNKASDTCLGATND